MKTNNYFLHIILTILLCFAGTNTYAYDIAVPNSDGVTIYYNYINNGTELMVTSNGGSSGSYIGVLNIPSQVTYMNRTRSVTSIGERAFYYCTGLTSITIPNSVIGIGSNAFYGCSNLASVTIPNSVIGIEVRAFYNCSKLTTLTIPNSVKYIGIAAFEGCSSLTSVTIPNSVTEIGYRVFQGCSSLTSVTIPNSMTSIGENFFYGCSSLTSITIPSGVTSIGNSAFYGCNGLYSVISKIENPCTLYSDCFTNNVYYNSTLYVPQGTINKYKSTIYWSNFLFIEEGDPSGGSSEPETCAKPTISYHNGKLMFNSSTEGVTYSYLITDTDIKAGTGEEVNLTVTYNVSVYASKAGYLNSETATGTLCWIDTTPTTEGITGIAQIPANAVLIQANDGFISISGLDESKQIAIYQTDGKQVATAKAYNGSASVATNISKGTPVIVKIGEKAVKVVMQ